MGDVYEEHQRYNQYLQEALGQGNADQSMDYSVANMYEEAKLAGAENKTMNEELAFTTLPSIIPHVLDIYQRANKIYSSVQAIAEKGQSVIKNLKTLPDDLQTLYKNKIGEIHGHIASGTEESYAKAKGLYEEINSHYEKGKSVVLNQVDELKTAGEKVAETAKTSAGELLEKGKATVGELLEKGKTVLPIKARQVAIKIKQFVTERSTASDKRNVLSNRATTSERQAEIASMSDKEVHDLFGKLPPGEYSVVKPSAGAPLLEQAKTAGGAVPAKEIGELEPSSKVQELAREQAPATKTPQQVVEEHIANVKTAREEPSNWKPIERTKSQYNVLTGEKTNTTSLPVLQEKNIITGNVRNVGTEYTPPQNILTRTNAEPREPSGATEANVAIEPRITTEPIVPTFGEVKSYVGSQLGEAGSRVPVLPTAENMSKVAMPKIPVASEEVSSVFGSLVSGARTAVAPVLEGAGLIGGIMGDVALGEGQGGTAQQKAQIGMGNIPVAETILNRGAQVVNKLTAPVEQTLQDAKTAGAQLVDKGQTVLKQTAEEVTSKATEASQQVADLVPKGEEALASVKTAGQGALNAVTGTLSDVAEAGTGLVENIASKGVLSTLGEMTGIAGASEAIPVVGEIIGLGTLIWGAVTGLEGLFGHHDAPPPPPQASQQASIVHQAGI